MKIVIIAAIAVGISLVAVFGVLFPIEQMEKQEFVDKVRDGYTDCIIFNESGGTEEELEECLLEYVKFTRKGCLKYPDVPGCEAIDALVDKYEFKIVNP